MTATQTRTATRTVSPLLTFTPTFTGTRTQVVVATPTPTLSVDVGIAFQDQTGSPGSTINLAIVTSGREAANVAVARIRLALDPATSVLTPILKDAETGEVDCNIEADLAGFASTGPVFYQPANKRVVMGFGDFSAPVQAFGRAGVILRCKFMIQPGTALGSYPLTCSGAATASNPNGQALTSACLDGKLTVTGDATCGNGSIDSGEDCDLGGVCGGGSKSGMACTSDSDCGIDEPGVCDGGTGFLRQCNSDGECGGGKCDRCRTFGGQGIPGDSAHTCSATCTFETRVPFVLKRGTFSGSTLADGSGEVIHSGILGDVPLSLSGSQIFSIGKSDAATGIAPIALKAADVSFPAISISTLACACVRAIPAKTCGGFVLDSSGGVAIDCSENFGSNCSPQPCTDVCQANLPCTFVHGPGNSGEGLLGCNGLSPIDVEVTQESRGSADPPECLTPGIGAPICADPFVLTLKDSSSNPGSAVLIEHTAIGVKTGACDNFCTDADPQSTRGTVNPLVLTTGTATGLVTNADGQDAINNGPHSASGQAVSCQTLQASNASGAQLVGTFTAINQNMLGDIVVEAVFEAQ